MAEWESAIASWEERGRVQSEELNALSVTLTVRAAELAKAERSWGFARVSSLRILARSASANADALCAEDALAVLDGAARSATAACVWVQSLPLPPQWAPARVAPPPPRVVAVVAPSAAAEHAHVAACAALQEEACALAASAAAFGAVEAAAVEAAASLEAEARATRSEVAALEQRTSGLLRYLDATMRRRDAALEALKVLRGAPQTPIMSDEEAAAFFAR